MARQGEDRRRTIEGATPIFDPVSSWGLEARDVAELAAFCKGLAPVVRRRLVWECRRHLLQLTLAKDASRRVLIVKLLMALLPDSKATIKEWILEPPVSRPYEVQFTLFCYLDQAVTFAGGRHFAREVPKTLRTYLLDTRSSAGRAAWMAADLLGAHWELFAAMRVLIDVARRARHSAARIAAIHGIAELMERKTARSVAELHELLLTLSRDDRSKQVRAAARVALRLGRVKARKRREFASRQNEDRSKP